MFHGLFAVWPNIFLQYGPMVFFAVMPYIYQYLFEILVMAIQQKLELLGNDDFLHLVEGVNCIFTILISNSSSVHCTVNNTV